MNRKQFIESHGATCQNWRWSWSFVNHRDRTIIFGAWDDTRLILSQSWQTNAKGRKLPGYQQSREHIRLIEEEGYQLKTFPLIYSDANEGKDGTGPAKIGGFVPKLTTRFLRREGSDWRAS